ncbi:phosphotransferase [Winogradskya consettensis]|uniref:phosphotransferase n=1 Tax=Winogradskya consettensis TaxID=113560 RepID=UPI001BB3ED90|nr:aminoglycoside phosphotransferase family protein [Actinoplanes consettensis]
MRSPTRRDLDLRTLDTWIAPVLGASVREASELSGGTFAAVWRATLTDGREIVVKTAAAPEARLLRYEAGLLAAESAYYQRVRNLAPVPEVLHLADDWLAVTLLPGRPLTELDNTDGVREQLGATIARVHELTGSRFGYAGARASGADWPAAFAAIVDDLLADARDWSVRLPSGIAETVERHRACLATVTRPALLHWDLWDGNVLARDGVLTGLVDGERYLYGDPLLDLVSPALFRRIEDEPDNPFLRGYAAATGLVLDDAARTRLALYRMHLYTLMVTECPSRGEPRDGERAAYLTGLLESELHLLGQTM